MADETDAPVATFRARGQGGTVFTFDELTPGTNRAEILAGQVHKGELVLLDADDNDLPPSAVEQFLADAAGEPVAPRQVRPNRGNRPAGDTAADNEPVVDETAAPTSAIPEGVNTVDDILDWVHGSDADEPADGWQDRANVALEAEQAKGNDARSTLVSKLEDALASGDDGDADSITVPPDMTEDETLAWVDEPGDDGEREERAKAALEAEQALGGDARTDLVEILEGLIPTA